ncbi:MAG: cryptochrome/photolyase family protein [Pseudomonadota bacterium]
MSTALFIWPHQLFKEHPGLAPNPDQVVLFEDPLFFGDPEYPACLHKQKLWLHRASMQHYAAALESAGHKVDTVRYENDADLLARTLLARKQEGVTTIRYAELVDFSAERRLEAAADAAGLDLAPLPSPGWLNSQSDNDEWSAGRKRWFMAEYYKFQRRRLDLLMDDHEPVGGKWSFDEDNRKKVPKKLYSQIPDLVLPAHNDIDQQARESVERDFPQALGSLDTLYYPSTHDAASEWLDEFLETRFERFGAYEDAIVAGQSWLWHAVLTPMLNSGLLTPQQVLERTLDHAEKTDVPLNSLEGFVRQLIGWREFMRATYRDLGVAMRTTNHWKHERRIPQSFYDASTGIAPIDDTITRILDTGYCHHIERLMVLGGFMFLCEFDPNDVYRWFMEMFVDSYDWVMVPNVYAMSQHADGGLITTKPYFSGSNYIKKMSDWGNGDWTEIWDGLYWSFIWKHRKELGTNPRWAMMCRTVERMDEMKRAGHLKNAKAFLKRLDASAQVS